MINPLPPDIAAILKRNPDGLLPAIAQDAGTGRVLMLAWMDDEALARTLATRQATYWSRSRREYWVKGATSGHTQYVRRVELDCDADTVLLQVDQTGAACHTGTASCFDAGPTLLHPVSSADEIGLGKKPTCDDQQERRSQPPQGNQLHQESR